MTVDPRRGEAFYRALFEASLDGILIVDDAGIYVDVNGSYCRMLKASREELIGRHFSDLLPEESLVAAQRAFAELTVSGTLAIEFPLRAADGTRVDLEWRSRANFVPGLHVCAARDIGERKRAEAELRQAKEAAEEAGRAKDRFLATLGDELRTPLAPVLAAVSGLADGDRVPPALRQPLDMIRRNVQLEARLIDDLLDLTRIERGKLELHPEITDLRKVVKHTVEMSCGREVAAGRLRVVADLAAGDHRIWADPSRLTQVLWNLLNNAVKFTPAGGMVGVRSRLAADRLVIEVADTGAGINPELLPYIFGGFEQGRVRSPHGMGGLGLGLAISRAIAEMHGGTLIAQSAGRGHGATFTLSLPASLPREER